MDALRALRDLHVRLAEAARADEVGAALYSVAQPFGFTAGIVVDTRKLFDQVGPALIYSVRGRAPIEALDERRRLSDNPLMVRARQTDETFVMSRVRADLGIDDIEWARWFPPYFDGYDGLVVPIHEAGGLAWYVGFAGQKPDLSPRARAVLSAAAYACYARFGELMDAKRPNSPLTQREAECLKLVAQGKTDAEIGQLLHISSRTVRFHVGNAKTKLGVATRIQAVAKRASGF